jgi:hypothetical protein
MRACWLYILLAVISVSCTSHPDEPGHGRSEMHSELIHSDLPLFTHGENMWPRHFYEGRSFGCTTRVALGDWTFREQDSDEVTWFRIDNYGVFHCWALLGESGEREELDATDLKPAFFVFLGEEAGRELWVAQIGVVPGSEYVLLARSPEGSVIEEFDVLQRRCPTKYLRDADTLDTLITRYCAVNDPADLRRLARAMIKLPALGRLSLAPN